MQRSSAEKGDAALLKGSKRKSVQEGNTEAKFYQTYL